MESPYVQAQELPTVELKPVEVVENRISPYAIGAQTTKIDSTLIKLESLPTLADIISSYTSLAIKTYGNGMLSTISFRGTGPSHTAILWNDINISYPMLGQSDLSMLSLVLSDKVEIQHGTGSSLYGSGALGGTVSLSSKTPNQGLTLSMSQWLGSFGTIKNNVRTSYANDNYFINVGTLWDQSANNFKFKNTTKIGSPTEEQQGADYRILGTSLESGFTIGDKGKLLISGQYFNADRNLQPSMNTGSSVDNQTDENLRIKAKYIVSLANLTWNLNYAYLHDVIGYNGEKTFAIQQVARIELERNILTWLKVNLAADYNFIDINSPFYSNEKTTEQRTNTWASFLMSPGDRLVFSLSLRQSFNPDYKIPFTPTLGAEYYLVKRYDKQLKIKSLLARGFRVPTLNERYWQPGGNTNLVPEDSYSAEFGLAGSLDRRVRIKYELTTYRMWVDNWILWTPQGSIWSPENIKYVDVYGAEASVSLQHTIGAISNKWLANYAFTKSINRTGLDQFDRSVNMQLNYVPIHKASITSINEINSWTLQINGVLTGKRYVTADNEESLAGYTLLNLKLGKSFRRGKYLFTGHINVNNILNTQYQSVENRAMPGINLLAGISVSYYKS